MLNDFAQTKKPILPSISFFVTRTLHPLADRTRLLRGVRIRVVAVLAIHPPMQHAVVKNKFMLDATLDVTQEPVVAPGVVGRNGFKAESVERRPF